jgi:protein import protein ZIM17
MSGARFIHGLAARALQRAPLSASLIPSRRITSSSCSSAFRPLRWRSHSFPNSQSISNRHASTANTPPQPLPHRPAPHRDPNTPVYELTFTCKACRHRSSHTVSKQGYHKATVLIQCPGCKARHLISDHLHVSLERAGTWLRLGG